MVPARARRSGTSMSTSSRDTRATSGRFVLGPRLADDVWGDNVWVELAGHAVRDAEIVRDLYAFAAARWVDEGRRRHYVYMPATDEPLVSAWFRLGFGAQHAFGI